MTFASVEFLLFFVILLLLVVLIQTIGRERASAKTLCHIVLLVSSYIFYGWWNAELCILLLGVTLIAFFSARQKDESHPYLSRFCLVIGVGTPLAVLGIFKYFDFFVESFCEVFHMEYAVSLGLILPVGISFYTFQALSYTIDVYTGRIEKEESFVRFALYISFFPQLVAGPIVKASEFLPQLKEERRVTLAGLESGVQIFAFGLFKKIVLADNLSVFVDEVYRMPQIFHSGTVLLAVISYAIQIYLDFSGYSDMAIGCAKCFGYDLNKNFNLPYISQNISEFWKRWHISLSSWLQQYLYIPLGGNRRGWMRTYFNLFLTMLLGGLWHGADWTFVLWGGLHGIALCIHKLYSKITGSGKEGAKNPAVRIVNILLTNIFVCFLWIFFRASDMNQAMQVIHQLFGWHDGVVHIYSWSIAAILILAAATGMAYVHSGRITGETGRKENGNGKKAKTVDGYYPILNLTHYGSLVLFFIEIGLILGLAYVKGSPFIYFQF